MSEVIAVMNQKGGCGKTTTVVNTATSLAVMGKSVLVVDMDPQANATTSFGIDKTKIENTIYDAIIGDINVKKATIPTFIKNLFIIPSNISLSLGVITVNALVASDSVLIPIQAEYYALEGVADLINTIKLVEQRLRSPTPIKGILLTLYDKRTRLSKDVYKELKSYFGETDLLFKTVIPRNIRLAEAPSFGKPCLVYDPDSTGTKAYLKLAKEIIQRDENVNLKDAKTNIKAKAELNRNSKKTGRVTNA